MRQFIAACVLAFGLPGLAIAQDKPIPTTKPTHGGHGSSITKNRDNDGGNSSGAGAALRGGAQQNNKAGGQQQPAGQKQ